MSSSAACQFHWLLSRFGVALFHSREHEVYRIAIIAQGHGQFLAQARMIGQPHERVVPESSLTVGRGVMAMIRRALILFQADERTREQDRHENWPRERASRCKLGIAQSLHTPRPKPQGHRRKSARYSQPIDDRAW